MPYVSLYRQYRPQTFQDVVGQDHVTTTLQNAIRTGRVASGYLFCGTRGTAKTTCARVLAKALNCIGLKGDLTEPSPDPCGVCIPCRAIASSSFVDVLEMDAASHGKVDDVRDLVASIKFPPMEGRFKVYIIDEAHQLSRDAMDAFLKTLEEPPNRVVFVLATTEVDKLPVTIASRCQVFEFKRGSVSQLCGSLQRVLKAEAVAADAAAVTMIARAAEGSYRDALSLLEQVLAFNRTHVTVGDVTTVLGSIDEDTVSSVVEIIARSDAASAFDLASSVLNGGKDVRQFFKSLSSRFRDLLFHSVGAGTVEDDGLANVESLKKQAALFTPGRLLTILTCLTEAEREIKWNTQHRLLLEMTLIRLTIGQAPTESAASVSTPTAVGQSSAPPSPSRDVKSQVPDRAPERPLDNRQSNEYVGRNLSANTPETHSAASEAAATGSIPGARVARAPEPRSSPSEDTRESGSSDLARLKRLWPEAINRMASKSPNGTSLLRDATPIDITGKVITLKFTSDFNVERMSQEKRRAVVEEILEKTLEAAPGTYKVRSVLQSESAASSQPTARTASPTVDNAVQSAFPMDNSSVHRPRINPQVAVRPSSKPDYDDGQSPFLEDVIAVFGGSVVDEDEP